MRQMRAYDLKNEKNHKYITAQDEGLVFTGGAQVMNELLV